MPAGSLTATLILFESRKVCLQIFPCEPIGFSIGIAVFQVKAKSKLPSVIFLGVQFCDAFIFHAVSRLNVVAVVNLIPAA